MEAVKETTLKQNIDLGPRRMAVVLGVPIDALTMEETLDRIEAFVQIGEQTGRSHQVTTVNSDFIVNAIKDPEVRYILQESDLSTADGMPIVLAANLLGVKLGDRVTGADLVPHLAKRAAEKGFSLFFLGASPGVAARAAAILKEQNPQLKIAGVFSPPFKSILEMDSTIAEQIKTAKPSVLLVAFGNPKQEKWIAMRRYDLGVPVMIGIGGTLDFIAGSTVRAPRWMQKSGLEWLHRMLQNPHRLWRRYVADFFVFGPFLARQLWLMKRFGNPPIALPVSEELLIDGVGVLRARGTLTIDNAEAFSQKAARLASQTTTLVIDLSKADFIDSAGVGALVHLTKELRSAGGELYLIGVPTKIRKVLELLHLDQYFTCKNRMDDILYSGKGTHPSQPDDNPAVPHPPDAEPGSDGAQRMATLKGQTWRVVQMPSRFDARNASQIHQECLALLEKERNILLDFSETVMLASAGLAVLVDLHRKTQACQGSLLLTRVSKDVLKVLQLVKFDEFLHIENPR